MKIYISKKIVLFTLLFLFIPIFFVLSVPQPPVLPSGRTMPQLWQAVANIAKWLFSFLAVAGVIGVVISGFNFVLAGGDSGKLTSARNWLIYSLIGVIVGSFGVGFVNWVAGIQLTI